MKCWICGTFFEGATCPNCKANSGDQMPLELEESEPKKRNYMLIFGWVIFAVGIILLIISLNMSIVVDVSGLFDSRQVVNIGLATNKLIFAIIATGISVSGVVLIVGGWLKNQS